MRLSDLGYKLDGKYSIIENGCWEWKGGKNQRGYGQVREGGKFYRAHRVSYAYHFGEIAQGLLVCHKCDNPPCINPEHLFLGTNADNMSDCARKGRAAGLKNKGSKNGRAVLSDKDVVEILSSTESQRVLASKYGVSKSAIAMLKTGKTWRSFIHD